MIKRCGCKTGTNLVKASGQQKIVGIYQHPQSIVFQDKMYGTGYRVHTPLGKTSNPRYRCTVCGKES